MSFIKTIPALAGLFIFASIALAETSDLQERFQYACAQETASICTGSVDQRATLNCLQSNESRISNKCSGILAEMRLHIGRRQAEGKWQGHPQNEESSAAKAD